MDIEEVYAHLPIPLQNLACSLNGWRLSRRRYGGDYREVADEYSRHAFLAPGELDALRRQRLRRHLEAAATTPYWSARFRTWGIDPARDDPFDAYAKLPILTKAEVQSASADLINPTIPKHQLLSKHTSGTTGAGLVFPETPRAEREQWAVWWRYRAAHGLGFDDWCGYFGGRPVVPVNVSSPPYWRVNRPARQLLFSAYHLSTATAGDYLAALRKFRPRWLHGYPSTMALLAGLIRSLEPDFKPWFRIVTIGAESLLEHQRNLMEEVFGCAIRQHYGLAEGTANISECPAGRLHVDEDYAHVEFLSTSADTSERRIVGCNWSNPAFPLLRYDTGDTATLSTATCNCGRPGRLVAQVDGRLEDYVVLDSGARVGRLDHIFKDLVEVREAQIRQSRPGEMTIRLVRAPDYGRPVEDRLLAQVRKHLGPGMQVALEYADAIERTSTGKLRFVVSQVGRLGGPAGISHE